jgi:hypothetical protein
MVIGIGMKVLDASGGGVDSFCRGVQLVENDANSWDKA